MHEEELKDITGDQLPDLIKDYVAADAVKFEITRVSDNNWTLVATVPVAGAVPHP